MRINRISILVVIALLVIGFLVIQSGGVGNFLSYDCQQVGKQLHVSWSWSFQTGCMIQQTNGRWEKIDTNPLNDNPSYQRP
jgi:hypothetical protein